MRCSYHVIPKALSLSDLKSRCDADGERLMSLSDDDDEIALYCSTNQLVSKYCVPFSQELALVILERFQT